MIIRTEPEYDELKSYTSGVNLENIVIKGSGQLKISLKEAKSDGYYVTVDWIEYVDEEHLMEITYRLYHSGYLDTKREVNKIYNKIMKAVKNGNYTIEISIPRNDDWEFIYGQKAWLIKNKRKSLVVKKSGEEK